MRRYAISAPIILMAVMPTLRGQCKSGALGAYAKVAVGVRGGGSLDNLTQVCFSQKLKSKEKTIRSVLFLPPRVVKDDSADAGKEEDSEEIKSSTVGLVSDALRKRGWQVDGSAASRQALTSDSKRSALVDYLRARQVNLFDQIANRPQDIAKGRYSLGEEAAGLGTDAGTDALVFVQSYSYSRWAERQMSMRISFADPRSGEVLCYVRIGPTGLPKRLSRENRIERILKQLQKIP